MGYFMRYFIFLLFFCLGLQHPLLGRDNLQHRLTKRIMLNGEKELQVNISFVAGKLYIRPADKRTLFKGEFQFKKTEPLVDYSVFNHVGKLQINMPNYKKNKDAEDNQVNISGLEDLKQNVWKLYISPDVPISFTIEMGASENDFDFGLMKIKNLIIKTGASNMQVDFSEPNTVKMEKLSIEAGVSKIIGRNFMNANFKKFTFSGGVGDYKFYLEGALRYSARVHIESGVSSTKLIIDPKLNFRAEVDKSFLSSVRVEGAREDDDDVYYSENYDNSKQRLNIFADTGVGSFKILLGD